ncbi:MAG TPA: hypothetical protein VFB35_06335 [Gaiellaceae bacterium]|nr:hypothetical protein [Gaiellaceae bacterium]
MRAGAPVPLTGRYAVQGALVAHGLELWARNTGADLELVDDRSEPARAAAIHEDLRRRCDVVLGPYGGDSTRAVAAGAGGRIVWNHGAAADDVQRLPGVVSLPSPASRYLVALARALPPATRIAVAAAPGHFARFARDGLAAAGIGVVDAVSADAILLCGPFEWELERFRRLDRAKVLGGVSPGLAAIADHLDPDGLLAPVQWHPDLGGPSGLDDYVAAQAYAAVQLAAERADLDAAQARALRTSTFFGAFELDETGLQVGHELRVVRWSQGRRVLL